MTSIFFFNFLSRIVTAPLGPVLEKDLGISHAQAGSLFLFMTAGYFVAVLSSGFVAARVQHHKVIAFSSVAAGVVLVGASMSQGLDGLRLSLMVMGFVAGFYLPSGIATLTSLVGPRHWGRALAIHELAPNLSFFVAPLVAEALLITVGWRGVFVCLAGACVVLGFAFLRWGKGGRFHGSPPDWSHAKSLVTQKHFLLMMALFCLGISGSMGLYTMLPLFLVHDHGMARGDANLLIGFSRILGMGSAFLSGWITDRLGARVALTGIFLTTGVATILLSLASGWWLYVLLFIQPMLAVCFFPAAFAALAAAMEPEQRSLAVSLTVPLSFMLGGGALPWGVGYLGQTVSFAAVFGSSGALILVGAWLASRLDPVPSQVTVD